MFWLFIFLKGEFGTGPPDITQAYVPHTSTEVTSYVQILSNVKPVSSAGTGSCIACFAGDDDGCQDQDGNPCYYCEWGPPQDSYLRSCAWDTCTEPGQTVDCQVNMVAIVTGEGEGAQGAADGFEDYVTERFPDAFGGRVLRFDRLVSSVSSLTRD